MRDSRIASATSPVSIDLGADTRMRVVPTVEVTTRNGPVARPKSRALRARITRAPFDVRTTWPVVAALMPLGIFRVTSQLAASE